MNSARKLAIVSGIGPSLAGTGRLIASLLEQAKASGIDLIFVKAPYTWSEIEGVWRSHSKALAVKMCVGWTRQWLMQFPKIIRVLSESDREMILFHPQNLGMFASTMFFKLKRGPKALFLLDSSFFCLRSYNHISGETKPCFRCVGQVSDDVVKLGCRSFPNRNWFNFEFLKQLKKIATQPGFRVLAQNDRQADLARKHFGPGARVQVAGMWTPEFDEVPQGLSLWEKISRTAGTSGVPWVVFHGHNLGAKGADWCLRVAEETDRAASNPTSAPQFLFPFPSPSKPVPKNVHFRPLSWETGLREEIERSAAVIVPSLWSACIEGSLVKSLGHGQLVFAVENASSFSSEIPAPVLLTLPEDPKKAAEELINCLSKEWPTLGFQRKAWFHDFQSQKRLLWTTLTTPSL